jgi:hypothetical protein
MNDHPQDGEPANRASESVGCLISAALILWIIGTIALFPWARNLNIEPRTNLTVILISIIVLTIGGALAITLGSILFVLRDVLRWIIIALISLIAISILAWVTSMILNWLFTPV